MVVKLKLIKGKSQGKEFCFYKNKIGIGRNQDNDLVVYDLNVSRHHVEIIQDKNIYILRDLGSRNGTRVNHQTMTDVQLKNGDIIQVGEIAFEFKSENTLGNAVQSWQQIDPPDSASDRHEIAHNQTAAFRLDELKKFKSKTTNSENSYSVSIVRRSHFLRRHFRLLAFIGLLLCLVAGLMGYWVFYKDHSNFVLAINDQTDDLSFGCFDDAIVKACQRVQFKFYSRRGRVSVSFTPGFIESKATTVKVFINETAIYDIAPTGHKWEETVDLKIDRKLLKMGENRLSFVLDSDLKRTHRFGISHIVIQEESLYPPSLSKAQWFIQQAEHMLSLKDSERYALAYSESYYWTALGLLEGFEPLPLIFYKTQREYKNVSDELSTVLESYRLKAEQAQNNKHYFEAETILYQSLEYLPHAHDLRRISIEKKIASLAKNHEL